MNSKIKSKRPIFFGKVLPVVNMYGDEASVRGYIETIKKQKPNITDEELMRDVELSMKKDSFYNAVMDEVASAYEFELDEAEVESGIDSLSQHFPNVSRENLKVRVQMSIYRQLIYDDLANDWQISISDEEVKHVLGEFYKQTGQPIREYLMDKAKFEDVRGTLQERLISERLMNAFVADYRVPEEN